MDESLISETLEALARADVARKARRHVSTLRGIRGTPLSEVARVAASAWSEYRPSPDDESALRRLYMSSWEDGLVAVGLLGAMVPDAPAEALDIGLDWLQRVDDILTADAMGWLVLGPAFAASGADPTRLSTLIAELRAREHAVVRRAAVIQAMAFLPVKLEGAAAAPLRERFRQKEITFVEQPLSELVSVVAHAFLRDEAPTVRKGLRRVLKEWVRHDPAAVVAWEAEVRGGLPKMLSAETRKARNKVKA